MSLPLGNSFCKVCLYRSKCWWDIKWHQCMCLNGFNRRRGRKKLVCVCVCVCACVRVCMVWGKSVCNMCSLKGGRKKTHILEYCFPPVQHSCSFSSTFVASFPLLGFDVQKYRTLWSSYLVRVPYMHRNNLFFNLPAQSISVLNGVCLCFFKVLFYTWTTVRHGFVHEQQCK